MRIHWDEESHLPDLIRLNNNWIEKYFQLEDADRELADDPSVIFRSGGHTLSITSNDQVLGVCALFRDTDEIYELARMAVSEAEQGKGVGKILLREAITFSESKGVKKLFVISNTKLKPAINLYKNFDFKVVSEGQHPKYKRGNIIMEKILSDRTQFIAVP